MLWLFVGCLAFTAAVAMVTVLSGSFNEFVLRVLASSASVSAASVCGMACTAFVERGGHRRWGQAGVVLAVATLVVALATLWTDNPSDEQIRLTMVKVVWSVAAGHGELLLLPRLARDHSWVQRVAVAAIATLALLLTYVVIDTDPGEWMGRLIATVSILVALLTLVVPVLWKLGGDARNAPAAREQLLLTRSEDGCWSDDRGRRYSVQPLDEAAGS